MDDNNKRQGNPMWIANGPSPNPQGRAKGVKRTFKRTIDRFFSLNITLKELQNIYTHLKPGKEQVDFLKALLPYHIAPLQSDMLSESDIDALYDKLEQSMKHEAKKKQA